MTPSSQHIYCARACLISSPPQRAYKYARLDCLWCGKYGVNLNRGTASCCVARALQDHHERDMCRHCRPRCGVLFFVYGKKRVANRCWSLCRPTTVDAADYTRARTDRFSRNTIMSARARRCDCAGFDRRRHTEKAYPPNWCASSKRATYACYRRNTFSAICGLFSARVAATWLFATANTCVSLWRGHGTIAPTPQSSAQATRNIYNLWSWCTRKCLFVWCRKRIQIMWPTYSGNFWF